MSDAISIIPAGLQDVPDLVSLINSAYRGDYSKKGWTTEALLLGGIRIDEEGILALLRGNGSLVLLAKENGRSVGCVHIQNQGSKMYLGLLTVSPELQARGTGRLLLEAAENEAVRQGCDSVEMQVISLREELIRWYMRRGYRKSGERRPFPGNPQSILGGQPLEMEILQKDMIPSASSNK